MLKDHFQRSTSTLNNLRSQHFKVSEYLNKGKYKLRPKFFGKGKRHYDFDINSQQFFHEYIDDIIFEPTQVQQIFYNQINKSLEHPVTFANKTKIKDNSIGIRKNPSQVRVLLARHFHNRSIDLKYKKYLTLLRMHNFGQEQHLTAVKGRTNLIDKQIQQCLSRQSRLQVQDYFQISYTQGGKPVPVNQNGQPIYKYLDEQDCWFSNINRDDIQVYLRNITFQEQVLQDIYWPYWYQYEYLIFSHGLEITAKIQQQISENDAKAQQKVIGYAEKINALLQRGLEEISPGNLQEKQNLTNFIQGITGLNAEKPLAVPIYPAIFMELIDNYNQIVPFFFKNLYLGTHKQIIQTMPKFNSFCSILFKYQNQQILEGQKQIKLGLQDEVDIRKQLITMLEEQWVTKHVKINYSRFQYKLYLKPMDWTLDTYSERLQKQIKVKNDLKYSNDFPLQQLIRTIRLTTYSDFRKIIRKRSEKIAERARTKFQDMQLVEKYTKRTDQQMNMQKLIDFYKAKGDHLRQLFKINLLKQNTRKFFTIIIKDNVVTNPVEIQISQTLISIRIREMRTKILNILNAMRCYQRNIDLDLRVIDGCQFKFQLDDNFLINSNKQTIEKFQKNVKQNQTSMSKAHSGVPSIQNQDFMIHSSFEKPMMYKKDKVQKDFYNQTIPHIFVIDGKKKKSILYDVAQKDLQLVEDRILQNGTYFINKYERIIKVKEIPELVDRIQVLSELFQLEEQYLYQKLNLIECYYYLYENTVEPFHAQKIGKIIIEIMYQQPKIDLNSNYFRNSYEILIETLRQQIKILKIFTKMIEDQEKQKNKTFHKKFASMCEIPLTLWAYAYCDIQIKGAKNYNKLQRMNSVSSKMSKNSKQEKQKNIINNLKNQIRQQFDQDSEGEEQGFDIQQYDEYMLKRNMDDIFEDIVGTDAPKQHKDKDAGLGVSSLGLQNLTVNPKFEGGPHTLHNYLPDIKITSNHTQKLLNFTQNLCWVSNIHNLIKKLTNQGRERYGYCSQQYQLRLTKQICVMMQKILLTPPQKLQKFHQFQTDDLYYETVTLDSKAFEQTMQPILQLPSAIQLSMHKTHQKHQNTLPNSQILQHFDLNILANLVKLEKPLNSAIYRELNLSINLIEFVKIRQEIWHIQLQREQLFDAYRTLGSLCDIPIQKYTNCYARSGLSQIFLASSEAKVYSNNFLKRPCFNQSIEQLRSFYQLQQAELNLLRTNVELAKAQIEGYIRASWDIQKSNKNYLLNRNQILLSTTDKKNVKMVFNRIKGHANYIASEVLKTKCYLKYKTKLKTIMEEKFKNLNQINFDELVIKYYLNNDTKKYSKYCHLILVQKIKRKIMRQYIKKYRDDIKISTSNNQVFLQLLKSVEKINNYAKSLPYLQKILRIPTQFQLLNKKAFYDQKKIKIIQQEQRAEFQNIFYLQSKEQLIQDWENRFQSAHSIYLQESINIQNFIKSTLPPSSKDQIFRWMFKIPSNLINDKQKQSVKHFLRICQPFTGKISLSQYRYSKKEQGSRNKFSQLHEKYSIIIQYIQSNLMVICLQADGDIIETIFNNINHQYCFQQKYPLLDPAAIYESVPQSAQQIYQPKYLDDSPLAPVFLIENRKNQFQQVLKKRIQGRRYSQKNKRFSVVDQILNFVTTKVQSYGVIRHCMLELKDEMNLLLKNKPEGALQYMKSKTENIFIMFWIAIWKTLSSKTDPQAKIYAPIFLDTLLQTLNMQSFQTKTYNNCRRGIPQSISRYLEQKQQAKIKFQKGVYDLKNDFLVSKLKIMNNFLPINLSEYMQRYVYKSENQQQENNPFILRHNWNFMQNFISVIKKPNKQFRYRLFAKIRELFQMGKIYLQTKIGQIDKNQQIELQSNKTLYFQYLMQSNIYLIALTTFKIARFSQSFPDNFNKFCQAFHQELMRTKQMIDINTFNIYDQFEAYKTSGKIIFTKVQNNIITSSDKISKIAKQQNNKLIRSVIFSKLTLQQLKNQILQTAIHLLKAEKIPKSQNKIIQNSSLIPRVHLISSFSSPLIIQRKTYISQQYKLAFVQAFINRFRNKVSRVDLLSSGYGFVITVPDLEDCVNYMNKLLFTFTEKQFKVRLQTFSQYYEILLDGIRTRNQTINQQKAIIKHLQNKVKNTLQAEYLAKVSKLLQQKVLMDQKLRLAEQSSNGLQHRVRKTVQNQYDCKISSLQKQNQQLRAQFQEFKDLLVKLTKDSTKNNFLQLVNLFKDQVSKTLDKKIDLSQSFKAISEITNLKKGQKQIVKEQEVKNELNDEKVIYDQNNIQKCKIGQQIIHDPYYVTKLINKMRAFNLFKMGANKIKYEIKEEKKISQLTSLHKIQDKVIAQTERQSVLRNQLTRAQQQLSKKSVQLQKIKHMIQSIQNEKAKLKILLVTKQKKIQQKQRQNQQIKKKIQFKPQASKIQGRHSVADSVDKNTQQQQLPKISAVRQQKKSIRRTNRQPFLTNIDERSGTLSLYEKFQLSNKDSTWRQKCQQLYLQNKKLLNQLEKIKQSHPPTATPQTRQGYSLNLRNKRTAEQSEGDTSRTQKKKFSNLSFKYGVMKG